MISLNGFLHRDVLSDIIRRWVLYQQRPGDCRALKRIINYNAYVGRLYLDEFAHSLFVKLHGEPVHSFAAATKGQLKDFVTRNPVRRTARIDEMIHRYQRFPEDYYRETPFDGRIYHRSEEDALYVGSTRIKRFRRIAEKSSRRIIDYIFQQVKANAEALANERAARLGIPKERLITPLDEQVAEFAHAERRVLKAIRGGKLDNMPMLPMSDVLGVKIVVDGDQLNRIIDILGAGPNTSVVEREVHRGRYNATNLIVRYRWPREVALGRPPTERAKGVLISRGIPADAIETEYRDFVTTAEDEVLVEVILSSCEEMLESEIGRCMHEDRLLAQRGNQQYHGSLAKNVEYLMEYMLMFCLSPVEDLGELPIRLWMHYMPDYIDQELRRLFGISPESQFTGLV